ncbi:hypothetical protein OG400_12550 [Micromonospora ureilytica]|uniref:hypothetical protein n=1 Tax=Micromonospora ureilytica TaxID=709868 RepID=UPI002E140FCE|nr:hypothetical protein OG400_12550 [Micromonospora ureilytica]
MDRHAATRRLDRLGAQLAAAQQAGVLHVAQPLLSALPGTRVLLADDVLTTGAQFDAVGRQLHRTMSLGTARPT